MKPKPLDQLIVMNIHSDLFEADRLRGTIKRYEILISRARRSLDKSYTNKALAAKHGVDASTISKIKNGDRHGNT